MNYEQKYNVALEQAKKELATCGSMDCDAARLIFRLFPQLAESEDERIRNDIRLVIEFAATKYFKETGKMPEWYDRIVAYLEKLKEQQPAEWGEEDDIRLREALEVLDESIKYLPLGYGYTKDVRLVTDWLKSLPYRFSLSSWGEEIRDAFFGVERNWKPSEGQIYSLGTVVKGSGDCAVGSVGYNLKELYEQLKALM